MMKWEKRVWSPDDKGFDLPGEGPSADRNAKRQGGGGGGPAYEDAEMEREGHVVLNQDGTRLGSWEGGSVGNPTGSGIGELRKGGEYVHAEADHLSIGTTDDTVLPEDGARRTHHGMNGGPGDLGHSGMPGGDPSNIGAEGDDMYGE